MFLFDCSKTVRDTIMKHKLILNSIFEIFFYFSHCKVLV